MGITASQETKAKAAVILVPPFIERDLRQRSRWTRSSWDYLFGEESHERKALFSDHFASVQASPVSLVAHLSPPEDERVTVKARIARDGGSIACRYYPMLPNQGTYLCFSASPGSKASSVSLQASAFDPGSGLGGWINAPLDKRLSGAMATGGVRYTSPCFTCGAIATLRETRVKETWLIGRFNEILLGARVNDPLSATSPEGIRERLSFAISCSPTSASDPSKSFIAGLEVVRGSLLTFAITQKMAIVRSVLNPFEDSSVVGITSHLSYGIKVSLPLDQHQPGSSGTDPAGIEAAVSYQMNKNWLIKAKCGTRGVDATIGFRMWSYPSLLVLLGGSYSPNFNPSRASWVGAPDGLRIGLTLQVENHGDLVYQRGGVSGWEKGRAVLQRHEARPSDVRNRQGVNKRGLVGQEDRNYNERSNADAYGLGRDRFL